MSAHSSSRGYFLTFGALILLTFLTVGASHIDMGTTVNLAVALAIASVKASLVALFFMHLAEDDKFHSVILVSAFAFLAIFVAFTMMDTETRGRLDPAEAHGKKPAAVTLAP